MDRILENRKTGFIKIFRSTFENKLICSSSQYFATWISILNRAGYKDISNINFSGKIITLRRGQFITGRDDLAKDFNIPSSTIEDILEKYVDAAMITMVKTNKGRLITVLNYDFYQSPTVDETKNLDKQQQGNNRTTSEQHLGDTIKNTKNLKNTMNIQRGDFQNEINNGNYGVGEYWKSKKQL